MAQKKNRIVFKIMRFFSILLLKFEVTFFVKVTSNFILLMTERDLYTLVHQ